MSEDNTGGPAFPRSDERGLMGEGLREGSDGMSLRDWFAGQALIGFLSNQKRFAASSDDATLARECFSYADAMLKAREATDE